MKHLKLFNLFEQMTFTSELKGPGEGGLLSIYDKFENYLPKINVASFPLVANLRDKTHLRKYTGGETSLSSKMIQLRGGKDNPKENEYKNDLFKCFIILLASIGHYENDKGNKEQLYKISGIKSKIKSIFPKIQDKDIQNMIDLTKDIKTGTSKLPTLILSQSAQTIKDFDEQFNKTPL